MPDGSVDRSLSPTVTGLLAKGVAHPRAAMSCGPWRRSVSQTRCAMHRPRNVTAGRAKRASRGTDRRLWHGGKLRPSRARRRITSLFGLTTRDLPRIKIAAQRGGDGRPRSALIDGRLAASRPAATGTRDRIPSARETAFGLPMKRLLDSTRCRARGRPVPAALLSSGLDRR